MPLAQALVGSKLLSSLVSIASKGGRPSISPASAKAKYSPSLGSMLWYSRSYDRKEGFDQSQPSSSRTCSSSHFFAAQSTFVRNISGQLSNASSKSRHSTIVRPNSPASPS